MAVNAAPITVYVQKDDAPFDIKKIYAFSGGPSLPTSEGTVGYWPGVDLTNTTTINGVNYYYYSFDEAITKVSVIFSDGTNNNQTKDIKDIQSSTAYKLTGSNQYNFEKVDMTMATPEISATGNRVTITCADTEAKIYYTLDGSDPTESLTPYEGAFDITETKTVKAIAIREGFPSSTIAEKAVTYVDPSTAITVYVQKKEGFTNIYAWYDDNGNKEPCGAWGGTTLTESEIVAGVEYWKYTFAAGITSVNVIFNGTAGETDKIENITKTTYYKINDDKSCSEVTIETKVATPTLFQYKNNMVKLECETAGARIYYTLDGTDPSGAVHLLYEGPFRVVDDLTIKAVAVSEFLDPSDIMEVSYKAKHYDENSIVVYVEIKNSPFKPTKIYAWDSEGQAITEAWSGTEFKDEDIAYIADNDTYYYAYVFDPKYTSVNVIFNNGSLQTVDIKGITAKETFYSINSTKDSSNHYNVDKVGGISGVENIITEDIETEDMLIEYYNLYGIKIENPQHGIYIRKCGNKVEKVVL